MSAAIPAVLGTSGIGLSSAVLQRASAAAIRDGNGDGSSRAGNGCGVSAAQGYVQLPTAGSDRGQRSMTRNGEIIGKRGRDGICIRFSPAAVALVSILDEVRDGDRGQDTNDGDDDHEFDQGETFFVVQLNHFLISYCQFVCG
jgi:hypothetical protein